ncbi:unnamed protein product [Phaedon cochleariae]|uniref:Aldehyde dehydrogenase n=1 Tax=Phaedon cochleariae TaxID=80249 RepID=A0A9P0GRI2_PHACE|nr:unnamed protein product [Phaedon cochleariae]
MGPHKLVMHLRTTFESGKTKPIEYRIEQLKSLKKMLQEKSETISQCLYDDLHKSKHDSILMEIDFCINDIRYTLSHIREWVKPDYPATSVANMLDTVQVLKEPFGVALVIGAWNYPLQLVLGPLIGAISAGNCVVIKPSELAPRTADFLAKNLPEYLDRDAYQVYEGGAAETTELLKERFDYIFYTGSTEVGKIVHAAAAKHLTPTTLELGGKSPVYLDNTADLETAARRILWGKCANAGQTCVAPDYLLCTKEVQQDLVRVCRRVIEEYYGKKPQESGDYGRIVNDRHFRRVTALLEGCKVAVGGETDAGDRYIAPTVLTDVKGDDVIMREEIFGPLLPIVPIRDVAEAIRFINEREKPLAMYIFSNNTRDVDRILRETSAGGVTVNDTIMHLTVNTLPFGGVGGSGMGSYHGRHSFLAFTHEKGVLRKNLGFVGEMLSRARWRLRHFRYPPYTKGKLSYLSVLLRPELVVPTAWLRHALSFGLGMAACYTFLCLYNMRRD